MRLHPLNVRDAPTIEVDWRPATLPRRTLIPLAVAVLAASLHAQQPAPGARLADVLAHLGAQATALDRSLPSFNCLQKANSDEL
ncbi:MAG TPA: hypothetical protein VH083_09765, partial [Myxococcales bacterium]|nr:hypothetical protein [Myxococcales bacterium]